MPNQYYDAFSFECLQERAKHATMPGGAIPENDPEALFMWQALIVATTAPGYTHLTPEEVFEHLKHGVSPQQETEELMIEQIRQLEKKTEDEDTPNPRSRTKRHYC